jgi:phosphohistidine phosphatase
MQTAVQVAQQLGFKKEIRQHPALAKEGGLAAFRTLLKNYADREAVMVVGHNPSLSRILSLVLTGGSNDAMVDLKKCGIAKVEYSAGRRALLYWCLTPKLTQAIQESAIKSSRPKTSRK